MSNDQTATTSATNNHHNHNHHHHEDVDTDIDDDEHEFRDIHALTPPPPPSLNRPRRRFDGSWETNSHRSSSMSVASETPSSENFTTMSREFSDLVIAGSTINNMNTDQNDHHSANNGNRNLERIREDEGVPEDTNHLAIVPDNSPMNPLPSPPAGRDPTAYGSGLALVNSNSCNVETSVQMVKKEETETKISAWQTAKISKINNRFKREDAVINGWENEQVQKATLWMKKVERKLEEKRAKAQEKMQNDIAKARRKAEERRASSEAKRGTKVAKVLEVTSLMRAVGRAPSKRSFF